MKEMQKQAKANRDERRQQVSFQFKKKNSLKLLNYCIRLKTIIMPMSHKGHLIMVS